jgi:endonuclease YncB( thermonuclease family)
MVLAGLALGPEHYAPSQASAQRAKRGIWQGKFVEPAQWRAEHPREDPE